MKRKEIQFSKYIAAFAITTLIFVIGLSIGSMSDKNKLDIIDSLEQEIKMDTMGTEIQYLLMRESPCEYVDSAEMARELGDLGSKLTFMESQLGAEDISVIHLKEYYHLLELRHWLFLKQAKEECNHDFDLVLYFYSNEGDCKKCEEQGFVLTHVHKKNAGFNVYSFDVNIDNPSLKTLKNRYNVSTTPTIVVNDNVFEGFLTKTELLEGLNSSKS